MSTTRYRCALLLLVGLLLSSSAMSAAASQNGGAAKAAGQSAVSAAAKLRAHKVHVAAVRWLQGKIKRYEVQAWHWQRVMGKPFTPAKSRQLASASIPSLQHQLKIWRHHATEAHLELRHPPHLAAWLCIQSGIKDGRWSPTLKYLGGGRRVGNGEGSWTTDGYTYDSGLQMDETFQKTYAAWLVKEEGSANHWNAYEVMWVAELAWKSRGFHPWPNTAHACGLIA